MKMLDLAQLAKSKDIHIAHNEDPNSLYDLLGYSKVKINGEWKYTISYLNVETLELYSRFPDDFKNFRLVDIRDR